MKQITICFGMLGFLLCLAACGDDSGEDPVMNGTMPTATGMMDASVPGTAGVNGSTGMPTTGMMMPMVETPMVPCGSATCTGIAVPGITLPGPCCVDQAAGTCGTLSGSECMPPPPSDPRCPEWNFPIPTCCGAGGSCGFNTGTSCIEVPEAFRAFAAGLVGAIMICDGSDAGADEDAGF
jgi:hypothetical protein